MSSWRPTSTVRLRKLDGSGFCETDQEIAQVFLQHFGKVLNIPATYDPEVISLVDQREIRHDFEVAPDEDEIIDALRSLKSGKAAGDSGIKPEHLKALIGNQEALQLLISTIHDFWETGNTPEHWNSLRLKTLPKSGDTTNVDRWRGIYLMDSVCKLVSKILQQRLDKILIEHGLECQNGFMGGRGTTDGISILYQALLKRREHQQA